MAKMIRANELDIAGMLQTAAIKAQSCKTKDQLKDVIKQVRDDLVHNIDMRSLEISESEK